MRKQAKVSFLHGPCRMQGPQNYLSFSDGKNPTKQNIHKRRGVWIYAVSSQIVILSLLFRTSTVGLPRESKISRARTLLTDDIAIAEDDEAAAPKAVARSGVAGEKA